MPIPASAPQCFKPSTTRIYHSYPGAAYVLPADDEERERLIAQHHGLKTTFGGQILLAPVALKDGDKVLDACTGTGIWLLDLAKEVPDNVQLQGFDIESRQFPSIGSQPKNLELSIQSVLSLPPDWTDRFTLVHQRLLVGGLRKDDWPVAMKELHRVTKPGGWVELCEFTKFGGGPVTDQWWTMAVEIFGRMGFKYDCGKYLERWMREAGFEDVQTVVRTCPIGKRGGERGIVQLNTSFMNFEMVKYKMLDVAGDLFGSEEEFDGSIERLMNEFDECECNFEWVVCFGRKVTHQ